MLHLFGTSNYVSLWSTELQSQAALEVLERYRLHISTPTHGRLKAVVCCVIALAAIASSTVFSVLPRDARFGGTLFFTLTVFSALLLVAARRLWLRDAFTLLNSDHRAPFYI